jgi:hypothetical protein
MRSPPLAPDELEGLPWLHVWFFYEDLYDDGRLAYRAKGWLTDHATIESGVHLTDFVRGFDFKRHRWLETRDGGFYRLGKALFDVRPPRVYIWRMSK